MRNRLDWKWIGIGAVIMIALNIVAAFVLKLSLGSQLKGVTSLDEINLSGGQIWLFVLANALSFLVGGYIVGVRSAGRTILEPGISALVAVLFVLLLSGQLTPGNLIAGGLVPFAAGVLGGWLGEQRQTHVPLH